MVNDLAARAAQYYWHHSIDLGGGVVTNGHKGLALCKEEADLILNRIALPGLSVLDVGAWNGNFSFDAKRRGAGRVLATDSYCWTHPEFRGRETFELARNALGLDIEAREVDAAQLAPETVGEFDVVLFLGVFYHRYDALETLARAASVAREVLVVETLLDLRGMDRPAMVFFSGEEANNDASNWWAPNELLMEALLRRHGFADIEVSKSPVWENRAIFHAWRSTAKRLAPLSEQARLKSKLLSRRDKIVRELRRPFRRLIG